MHVALRDPDGRTPMPGLPVLIWKRRHDHQINGRAYLTTSTGISDRRTTSLVTDGRSSRSNQLRSCTQHDHVHRPFLGDSQDSLSGIADLTDSFGIGQTGSVGDRLGLRRGTLDLRLSQGQFPK